MSNIARAAIEAREQHRGLVVIAVLAVLTIIEYLIAVELDNTQVIVTALAIIATVKAIAIMEYFMHLSKVWRGEGEHA